MTEKWVDCCVCGTNASYGDKDDYIDEFGPLCGSCQDTIEQYKKHMEADDD